MANTVKFFTKSGVKTQNVEFTSPDTTKTSLVELLDTGVLNVNGDTTKFPGNILVGAATDNGVDKIQVAGTLTATGYKSTVATGTAPFTVASTTRVANLNVATAGLADTATALATARTINGVSFNGTANITITAEASDVYAWAKAATKPTYTKSEVGLANVDNTADTAKPVSTAQQTALNLKANLASPSFTGNVTLSSTSTALILNASAGTAGQVLSSSGAGATPVWIDLPVDVGGTVTSVQASGGTTGLTFSGGPITGAGTLTLGGTLAVANGGTGVTTSTGTGSVVLSASPTFTGTVSGITKAMVGLANVDNTADSAKPVSTAQQTALNLKANLASPAFTGSVTLSSTTTPIILNASAGTTGQVLTSAGTGATPTWTTLTIPAGTVTSINASGGTTGLTFSGGPVTTSGTLTMAGTLAVANGGTGVTTSTGTGSVVLSAGPTFTGAPAAPTAAVGTNTTQLATTAFVNAEIANDAPSKTGTGASGTWGIAITGNAATATTLATARTINGVSFDGSANITVTAASPFSLTPGSYLTGGTYNGSAAVTVAVDATSANTVSKVVARDASGNFAAGTVTVTALNISTLGTSGVGTVTTTSVTPTALLSLAIATWSSCKTTIQATKGTDKQLTELLILHDGTTAYATEYGTILSGAARLFDVDVDISGGNLRVMVTSASATSTVYKTVYTAIAT